MESSWITFIERLGLPIFLILFCCAIIWKLLPHVIAWFTASTKTAQLVADSIPGIRDSLATLADQTPSHIQSIDLRLQILEKLMRDVLETRKEGGH